MVNDPIADLLTRIRNGHMRSQGEVSVPSSKMLNSITTILKKEGYIQDYDVVDGETAQKNIVIKLRYDEDGKPIIHKLQRVSKPGLRVYKGYRDIPKVLNGLGINIFSTPKGVLTGEDARNDKVGGEYLCNIW